jgi:hypothetical protein
MPKYKKIKTQPRIPGVQRVPGVGYFTPEVEQAIQWEQKYWKVSRSFVINNAVAFALDVHQNANQEYRKKAKLVLIKDKVI